MNLFANLHHICLVANDIDKTQAHYQSIGIGPWQDYPPLIEYTELTAPNSEAFAELTYHVCSLPNVQVQLCQPLHKRCP
ncbi:hypothetical protein AB8B21_31255 [Tardiphaga sp. 866_E4_N2_1]|uniref:hypothetical protein n=1 Tax=unclassified Tardiphaga TaxID=2631404 RepID=UPI003F248A4E